MTSLSSRETMGNHIYVDVTYLVVHPSYIILPFSGLSCAGHAKELREIQRAIAILRMENEWSFRTFKKKTLEF